MLDIAIIGGGVIGGMVAREFTKYTKSVVILEAEGDVSLGASRANSGIVHAGYDAKEGTLKARLNLRGSEMMEDVCSELGVKYKRNGSLVVGFGDEDKKTLSELASRAEKNGVRGVRLLSRDEVLALEPNIGSEVTDALYAPSGAIVCPYELCMAAIGSAMDNGADLMLGFRVDKIEKIDGGYKVFSGDKSVEAKIVINCAGIYSDYVARLVGDFSFSLKARRGEYLLLDKECGTTVTHTIFRCPSKMGKGILVSPTVDGNLLVGPTALDIEDKSDKATTKSGLDSIRALASKQVENIDFSKVITSFSGLRSTPDTGDFVINSPKEGFINVAGIESPGLSASPAIAEYVLALAREGGLDLSLREDFVRVRRPMHYFSEMTLEEKNELIKERPEFAEIVCRCETVTAGEILDAIRTNPRPTDVDGVKRRTRATMGRCQGGFCTPYIIELLSKELSVDYTAITKHGGGSYINLEKTKG